MKKKNAISLIVLVITIIVMAILATTVVITLSNTNIIEQAKATSFKSDMSSYKEVYELYVAGELAKNHNFDRTSINASNNDDTFKAIFGDNVSQKYVPKLSVKNGNLQYETDDAEEKAALNEIGITSFEWAKDEWFMNCTLPSENELNNLNLYDTSIAGKTCFDTATGTVYSVSLPDGVTALNIPDKIAGVKVNAIEGTSTSSYKAYSFMPKTITQISIPAGITLKTGAFDTATPIYVDIRDNGKADLTYFRGQIMSTANAIKVNAVSVEYVEIPGEIKVENISEISGYVPMSHAGVDMKVFKNANGEYEIPKKLNIDWSDYSTSDYDWPSNSTVKMTQTQYENYSSNTSHTITKVSDTEYKVTNINTTILIY